MHSGDIDESNQCREGHLTHLHQRSMAATMNYRLPDFPVNEFRDTKFEIREFTLARYVIFVLTPLPFVISVVS